jgi:hypothetical protein
VTYQQQSAALAARVCGVGEVRGVEDGVALAQELGLKGFSSMGRGGACVNVAQEVLSAAWVKSKDLTRHKHPASSMLTALGPHVAGQPYFSNSVLVVLCLDLPAGFSLRKSQDHLK